VCSDHFARLWMTDTHSGQSGKVELAAYIRSQAPVTTSIGPVLHVHDVAGGKVGALFTCAEARDFIDIDAMVISGRFTRGSLQKLAASKDAGFDLRVLADLLAVIDIYPDAEFSAYGQQDEQIHPADANAVRRMAGRTTRRARPDQPLMSNSAARHLHVGVHHLGLGATNSDVPLVAA